MSVNKYAPHVLILPEDDANSRIANGFQLALPGQNFRKLQILPEAGGWMRVRDSFLADHVSNMETNPNRLMILVIDFDQKPERLQSMTAMIPATLRDRVFVVGALSEPEKLREVLGPYEAIGRALAKDCDEGVDQTWGHDLLRNNTTEVQRMRDRVRPILFGFTE